MKKHISKNRFLITKELENNFPGRQIIIISIGKKFRCQTLSRKYEVTFTVDRGGEEQVIDIFLEPIKKVISFEDRQKTA